MKKAITLIFLALFVTVAFAQQPQGTIMKASEPPVIDGVLDAVWEDANVYDIDKPYRTEVPTIGAADETTWRALWDADGMYVFVVVNDDQWYPSYMTGGNSWEYDKPEIYFDVNFVLNDGRGASSGGSSGHHQIAPGAIQANIDGTATTETNGVVWAFKTDGVGPYTVEYFVPWTLLTDENGIQFDKTAPMGFDVTIIDRDPGDEGRRRMVWANTGVIDESWSNMDDVGIVVLDGADANIFIDSITLTGGTIDVDNGTLQIGVEILPEDATIKTMKWRIEAQDGRARVDNTGLVTAIANGVVTVHAEATDGSYEVAQVDVTISNQNTTKWELNIIRNGLLNDVEPNGQATHWGGWGGDANSPLPLIVDGVAVLTPVATANNWQYQFNQQNLTALPDVEYLFEFVTWADAPRTFTVDFEDIAGNGYNRYGSTADPRSGDGRSEWTFDVTTEATLYSFDVTFDQIVSNTVQKVQYMVGTSDVVVYLDSIMLISLADLGLVSARETVVKNPDMIKLYPNPTRNELNVVLTNANELVTVFNTLGVKVEELIVPGTQHRFDVSTYPKGLYFVRTNNSVVKFIVK